MAAKMIAVILLLTYLGIWLDQFLKMTFSLFTLIGAFLGSLLAIYSIIRDLTK